MHFKCKRAYLQGLFCGTEFQEEWRLDGSRSDCWGRNSEKGIKRFEGTCLKKKKKIRRKAIGAIFKSV